jgi:hypothetical protein
VNPNFPRKSYLAANTTARGNVVVYELFEAIQSGDIVLYTTSSGTRAWVDSNLVGSTPEEAVRRHRKSLQKVIRSSRRQLRSAEKTVEALTKALKPRHSAKLVVKRLQSE